MLLRVLTQEKHTMQDMGRAAKRVEKASVVDLTHKYDNSETHNFI